MARFTAITTILQFVNWMVSLLALLYFLTYGSASIHLTTLVAFSLQTQSYLDWGQYIYSNSGSNPGDSLPIF